MSPIQRFWNRQLKIHRYFKITGGYAFMGRNILKFVIFLGAFGLGAWLLNKYVFNFAEFSEKITTEYSTLEVLSWLLGSEIVLGILPPEAFIVWAKSFSQPYLMVAILASVSYAGGLISYQIGSRIDHLPKVHAWIHKRFEQYIFQIKRYGGLLIAVAALTPLPYPLISMISGLAGVKFSLFARVALIRYARFFIWAYVLFGTF